MAGIKHKGGKADRTSARPIEASRDGKGPTPDAGFLAIAKLKRAGGSLVMTVPAAARNLLGLIEGQEMAISVKGTQVIAEPMPVPEKVLKVRRPKYTLDELVAGYDADTPLNDDEREWMDAPPVGREVW
jgi:antitoxin ChpS